MYLHDWFKEKGDACHRIFCTQEKFPSFYKEIKGWCFYEQECVFREAVHRYDNCNFLEIGSFQGRSACFTLEYARALDKNINLTCIDLWPQVDELDDVEELGGGQGTEGPIIQGLDNPIMDVCRGNLAKAGFEDKVTLLRGDSPSFAKDFPDRHFKFMYIDGSHFYDGCFADLEQWFPKLDYDGTMFGDDYHCPGVKKAVKEFFRDKKFKMYDVGGRWLTYQEHSPV